jgi:hypothetical protein
MTALAFQGLGVVRQSLARSAPNGIARLRLTVRGKASSTTS